MCDWGLGVRPGVELDRAHVVLGEDQLRSLLDSAANLEAIRHQLSDLLGAHVDADLEPFRRAGEGTAVTWLHQVG